jgi:Rod binding domain-containing protein
VSILVQSMRRAVPQGTPTAPGRGERLFREMLDEQWARNGAVSGGFGLGEMLYRQLSAVSHQRHPPAAGTRAEQPDRLTLKSG